MKLTSPARLQMASWLYRVTEVALEEILSASIPSSSEERAWSRGRISTRLWKADTLLYAPSPIPTAPASLLRLLLSPLCPDRDCFSPLLRSVRTLEVSSDASRRTSVLRHRPDFTKAEIALSLRDTQRIALFVHITADLRTSTVSLIELSLSRSQPRVKNGTLKYGQSLAYLV
uniref:Uncharacterized protein n=1 Tax=Knipowitschia caucasica TaxID=637954 RepID=A0AAV2LI34_KNICA